MKKIIVVLAVLIAVLGLSSCGSDQTKVGFIGPLTGEYANYGVTMSQAVQIAIEERNEAVGSEKYVMVAEDSEGKAEKANSAIEKLSSIDEITGLVGCVFSSSSLQVAPRAEADKIVMISPSSTHPDLPGKGDFIFRDVANDSLQAEVFGQFAYQRMGLRNIAILYIKNDYSQGLADAFKATFEAQGGVIVAVESGVQGDKDFKTQLTKIKGQNPDAIFVPNYVAEIALMLKQADQLGIDAQMLSADGISNPDIFDLAGDLADGVIFSGPEMGENPKSIAFSAKYEEAYGIAPDSFTLNAYDAANIILDAVEKVGAEDRDAIRDYVASVTKYDGVSGEFSFAADGDVIKNIAIIEIQNGEYVQTDVLKLENGSLVDAK